MVSQKSSSKRSPRRRRAQDVGGGTSTKEETSTATPVTSKYFGEESELPLDRVRPPLPSSQQEFILHRSDEMAAILPPAPEPKIMTIEYDPIVVHTLALLRYRRMLSEPGMTAARIGPIPECGTSRPALLSQSLDGTEQLSEQTVAMLLRRAMELLCGHVGFMETDSRCVNLLARITASKLRELWSHCKVSNVRRFEGRETAFTSPMMHTLQLSKISRLTDLRDFYIRRFRNRRDQLLAVCQKGREALLKPPERRLITKKRSKREGSRSDSEEESNARKREHIDKETDPVNELNFLDD
uniref:Uncharacterized protein n=1 Tax=Parascaris univalens TaxID=6257 RepID=A0A915AEX1_PARUN